MDALAHRHDNGSHILSGNIWHSKRNRGTVLAGKDGRGKYHHHNAFAHRGRCLVGANDQSRHKLI